MIKKKLIIFTGSRADYGIMSTLIKKLDNKLKILIFAGSDHFSKKYGNSYKEILRDGNKIQIKSDLKSYSNSEPLSLYCSKILQEYSLKILRNNPSSAVVLGDRYEAFIFSFCCFLNKIPIFHLHGGELTEGVFDDNLRHSISKFSNFHFVTNNIYKKRLMQLGENPKKIFNFGSLGEENFRKTKIIPKINFFKKYKIPLNKKIVLVTLHPETMSNLSYKKQISSVLEAVKYKNKYFYIFTSCNSDPGSKIFINSINTFIKNNSNTKIIKSLGKENFINLLKNVNLVIGNSSSGILETPSANVYALNIGNRQKGRNYEKNIVNVSFEAEEISKKIEKYINKKIKIKKKFKDTSKLISKKILQILNFKKIDLVNKFYDIKFK
tara:strand:- start:960 stop:2102 length:1143 start_codon:yes stop_codon:yes gene_type:complete